MSLLFNLIYVDLDMLLNQKYLGSVIREVDDTDSYGFISVVPMAVHKVLFLFLLPSRFLLVSFFFVLALS